jgi:hypothetical protein
MSTHVAASVHSFGQVGVFVPVVRLAVTFFITAKLRKISRITVAEWPLLQPNLRKPTVGISF